MSCISSQMGMSSAALLNRTKGLQREWSVSDLEGGWEQHLQEKWSPWAPAAACNAHSSCSLSWGAVTITPQPDCSPCSPKTPLPLPEQGWDRRSAEKQRPKTSLTTVLRAGLRAAGLDQGTWPVMFYCAIWHGMRKQLPLLLPDRGRKDTS